MCPHRCGRPTDEQTNDRQNAIDFNTTPLAGVILFISHRQPGNITVLHAKEDVSYAF